MSQFYFNQAQQSILNPHPTYNPPASGHNHHGARSRRGPRFSQSQNNHHNKQHYKNQQRGLRESAELAQAAAFRKDFEAARSFDLEDDEIFCPWHLLTEDDLQSINSSPSDRSSLSSGSPEASPMQQQMHPAPTFALSAASQPHMTPVQQSASNAHLKIHQPLAQRTRNAIPIVDPNSRNESPPTSVSPARQGHKQYTSRRW